MLRFQIDRAGLSTLNLATAPLLGTLLLDATTKRLAHMEFRISDARIFGETKKNAGVFLGVLDGLPVSVMSTCISIAVALIITIYALTQYILPGKRPFLRTGSSLLMGGILGNALERALHGSVTDFGPFFTWNSLSYFLNFADIAQWIGYFLLLVGVSYKKELLDWQQGARVGTWVDSRFQLKFSVMFSAAGFAASTLMGFIAFVFVRHGTPPGNSTDWVPSYLVIWGLFSIFISLVLFVAGSMLSERIAGPIFAFDRALKAVMQGRRTQFNLRNTDEFQFLRSLFNEIEKKIPRDSEGHSSK